ncbi:MAG: SdrD B-like domain-containing protein, partial [Cyanobacteria bacterium J06614_10]
MSERYLHYVRLATSRAPCRFTSLALLTCALLSGDVLTAGANARVIYPAPATPFQTGASSQQQEDLAMGLPGDYGDAPDTYGTDAIAGNSSNNSEPIGPHHTVVSNLYLGTISPDSETDAVTPLDGTGDAGDEDGVTFLSTLFTNNNVYTIGNTDIVVTNTGNASATLHAWLDFDGSGTFDADEYTSQSVPPSTGSRALRRDLEWRGSGVSGMRAGRTYARFRLTTDASVNSATPGGPATDGEVEDYAVIIREPGSGNGGVCNAAYSLVYSGQAANIYAVHVESGAALPLTTNALATANGMATDHLGRLVYYADNNSIYAWNPITQQHTTIENNFTSYLSSVPTGFDLGSGGAAYYDGSLYQGVDTGIFEIYKVDFVPGSNGRTVQAITPIGINNFLTRARANWGDFIIDNNGLMLGQSNGSPQYWTYDLTDGTFTGLTAGPGTPSVNFQIAKDGQGRLWALVTDNTIVQMEVVGNTFRTVGDFRSTGIHSSFDGAECVRGLSIIGDRVWEDTNGNAIQDAGEPDIAGVTVDLIWDLNGNGIVDTNEPTLATQTTNSNGYYEFNELIFGNYIAQVTDTNNVLADRTLTSSTSAFSVAMPAGINTIDIADFGYQPVVSDPEVLLVKRVTAINNNRAENSLDGTPLNAVVNDGVSGSSDDHEDWPNDYLIGALNGGLVRPVNDAPADQVEYSIYLLSAGDETARSVWLCDLIPENTTFLADAYDGGPAADPLGNAAESRGIALSFNGSEVSLTGAADGDRGYYFPPTIDPSTQFSDINCGGPNTNGAIVVNFGD